MCVCPTVARVHQRPMDNNGSQEDPRVISSTNFRTVLRQNPIKQAVLRERARSQAPPPLILLPLGVPDHQGNRVYKTLPWSKPLLPSMEVFFDASANCT